MRRGLVKSSKYSPGNMNRESLESLFVGRHRVLSDVVKKIQASARTEQKHYVLIVGPRGSGKTHFVALAYHRLLDEAARSNLAIAYLNEEEWGVASYLDFLVRVLRSLTATGSEGLGREIEKIFEKFAKNSQAARSFAESLLKKELKGRTLLIICENLVDLFEGLAEEGQKRLRSFIQETGNWTILATTPALFSAITLQRCPFFGFFTIRHLNKIDYETALELLIKKAQHEGKFELAAFLATPVGRARVRAIHHLAGGNHRVYVVLSDFLNKESLNDLVGPFMQMVDDLTPYYQDRMRQLAPAQRKIVEYLCRNAAPSTVKEVALSCLMSQQTAAKQLGELSKNGFINRLQLGRNTLCELSEPLMRICIEVKDNRTEHLQLFVEFLRRWFSSRELQMRLGGVGEYRVERDFDRDHVSEAMSRYSLDHKEPFIDALMEEAFRCLERKDFEGLAVVQAKIALETGDAFNYSISAIALLDRGYVEQAISAATEALRLAPEDPEVLFTLARAYASNDNPASALIAIDKALSKEPGRGDFLCLRGSMLYRLDRYAEVIDNERAMLAVEPDHWHSYDQLIYSYVQLDRIENAQLYLDELLRKAPDRSDSWVAASYFRTQRDDLTGALEAANHAVRLDADNADAFRARGNVYLRLEDYDSAITDLKAALKKTENKRAGDYCSLSRALLSNGEYSEALRFAKQVVKTDPKHTHGYYVQGVALLELGKTRAGVSALRKLLTSDHFQALKYAADVLADFGQFEEALSFVTRILLIRPGDSDALLTRSRLHIAMADYAAGQETASAVLAGDPTNFAARLLVSEARAASESLDVVLRELAVTKWPAKEAWRETFVAHIASIFRIAATRQGARGFSSGLQLLLAPLSDFAEPGAIAEVLTDLLDERVADFGGTVAEWEEEMEAAIGSLRHIEESKIPLQMLKAFVLYKKSGDERYVLALPLEQRSLLEIDVPDRANTIH